jgi:hypothetical protein
MLEIKKNKIMLLDGDEIDLPSSKVGEFLIGNLENNVIIDDDVNIGELVHLFYDIKDFINNYFCEEYEAVRSLITMGKFQYSCECLEVKKVAEDEDGIFYLNVTSNLIPAENSSNGVDVAKDLKIKTKDLIENPDEAFSKELKTTFKLVDILKVIFEDFIYTLRNESVLQ